MQLVERSTATAPAVEEAPPLSRRERTLGLAAGLWMIIGLFLDGWAHDDNRAESFFTPWHAVLYSGFAAAAAVAARVVLRRRPGRSWRAAVPEGHALSLVALTVFAVAAAGDLGWHELFGIEVGVEALLSPTHLVLLGSGLVLLSAPVRDRDRDQRPTATLRGDLPVVLDLALLASVAGFFLVFVSATVNDAGEVAFSRLPSTPHDHPPTDPAELLQILGVGSVIVTSLLVAVPLHLLWSRRSVAGGSTTLLVTLVGFSQAALDQFEDPWIIAAAVLGGVAAEQVLARRTSWLAAAAGVLALWVAYFGSLELDGDRLRWTAELWIGTAFVAAMAVAGVGLVVSRGGPHVSTH